jgi:hypothetical protein
VNSYDTTHIAKYEWEKHLRIDRDSHLEIFQTYSNIEAEDHFNTVFKKVVKDVALQIHKASSNV